MRPACRQALADSGYEATLDPGPLGTQVHLRSGDILSSLVGVERTSVGIDVARMRQIAAQAAHDPSRADPYHRAPLFEQLNTLSQLTIAIEFDFDSARISPRSYRAIGLMADALYHPVLYGYCFLIVGNTDATGRRDYNLKLSDRRAEAIRQALINPFGIGKLRIDTLGLGEEQLLDPQPSQGNGEPARPVDQCRPVAQQPGVSCRWSEGHQVATVRKAATETPCTLDRSGAMGPGRRALHLAGRRRNYCNIPSACM